ncbi:hypothetical protein U7230_08420 [Carboxydochorda subterranea]|uniref:Uncharacterized protein n=1 Tax=Carboxydichorda subterranea TaxID=3109565 RepID=A0ABZ1BU00_9FIRM|nr:hypothetical protein [Limnochorda sp. L945t]WRP16131.1 hypothetical protein U7230_08420 [Limnochorda sp. L945t]
MAGYLCDHCRYDYGDACRRPERPNARHCPDFVPRENLWTAPPPVQLSAREFLDSLPVVTHGDHPEIRSAARERWIRRIFAAAAILGLATAILLTALR